MKIYSIETLRQHVYDYGMENTCKMLGLTTIKARKILNGGKISQKDYSNNSPKPIEPMKQIDYNNPNIKALYRVFSENYEVLQYKFCRSLSNNIDINSLTFEDKFHNAFLKLLEKEFNYLDDKQTLTHIEKHFFFSKKTAKHKLKVSGKKFTQFDNNYGKDCIE